MKYLLIVLLSLPMFAQTSVMGSFTVATLPAAANAGRLAFVTDATSAITCAAGGGSVVVLCKDSGAAWAAVTIGLREYTLVNIACTLTSLGASYTECTNQLSRNFVDLSSMTTVQLVMNLSAIAVTGDVRIDCSNDNTFASPTTLTTYDNPGANTLLLGTVDTIPAGCKTAGGVYLRAGMLNGNTTESPAFRFIRIHVQ